ncbi:MAG: xanthine dehydrogenase family protein molybdopterin-binding subunit [Candidatus Eremiobacteraeota bacterium]|nr:xanthine dehydrogenase family protein molybdopterin-binding subunit [Candidatus Eremiobacteraeota bacterium]
MEAHSLKRTDFIKLTGALGAGLGLGFIMPARAQNQLSNRTVFAPSVWVRIAPDETITVMLSKSEMGQGVIMGMPTILADELDANIDHVRTEFAPPNLRYIDPDIGDQVTGGSTAAHSGWMPLRRAGAAARAMLVAAAAKQWGVEPSECTTRAGSVYHRRSNRTATYGSLAIAASALPVPTDVPLKSPDRFTLIGKPRPRTDIPLKVNGSAQYGIDVRVPNMKYAAIARSPVFGGRVKSFDARKAKAVPGVIDVVQISNGVAIVAKNTWAAFQGKNALAIVWDEGPNAKVSTESLFAEAEHLARTRKNERVAISRGKPDMAAGTVVQAEYRAPFLAHAAMEPMNTTADVRDGRCEVWTPTQVQLRAQAAAAKGSGLPPERCTIHTTFLGGGFGRRLEADYVQEAAEVSKAIQGPVKVTWTREDDIKGDFYRAMSLDVVRGVVSGGELKALSYQVVQPSWIRRWHPPEFKNGIDAEDLNEVINAPYFVPNFRVTYIDHEHGIPIGSWRATNANWHGFVTETFIDELAHAAGKNPLAFRLSLLKGNPRAANVLELAAEKAGWGLKRDGIAQGLAVTFWHGSYAAMVADVSMRDKMPKVHRVVAVVDCGTVINPDIVAQQAQGATNFGLSAALTGKITIADGRVVQSNFYDYTVLRMADAPSIEVHIVPSSAPPKAIGEVCTPPIAPAVGNAVAVLTGKRVRMLPFVDALA